MASIDRSCLNCSCLVETSDNSGTVTRKQSLKKAVLNLGRNTFGDIVLQVSYPEGKQGPFTLQQYTVHKRFLNEGKATINLSNQKMKIMVSNCPPEQLRVFLTSLTVKVNARGLAQGKKLSIGGNEPSQFEEISPLTTRDLEQARKNRPANHPGKENTLTPQRRGGKMDNSMKRKLCEIQGNTADSEGPPAKKLLLLSSTRNKLCKEQLDIIDMVHSGLSVFFTGSAGTGKTYLLQRIIKTLPPETTFVTASTGAAACHIGGTTLHSFAGIGKGDGSLNKCVSMASGDHRATKWRKCKCLIIDEISMIEGEYFDKLEAVARALRNSNDPFGGIQLVLCGDFLQLPPVSRESKKLFCFQANSWHRCVTRSVELVNIYRQKDKQFIAALQNIRIGRCPDAVTRLLRATENQKIESGGIRATRLYTHTEDVESTNLKELSSLTSESRSYTATDSCESTRRQIDTLCPAPHNLILKKGAQVMLVKNIDVSNGLVNGARGVVEQFTIQGFPVVQFISGRKETIKTEKWVFRMGGGSVMYRKQLPLKLAWAISIHKSQGMTLDCVEISLGRAFERGQAYVALSRASNLHTLRVLDFSPSCVQADSEVLDYYRALRRMRRNYIEQVD